jgi:chromosome segregation ATPase
MKLREYELREEVAVLRQKYDIYNTEKEQHVQALEDQITVLRNEIGFKERELLNTSEKINRAEGKIDQLLAENNDLLNAIEQIKRDIDELEHAHLRDLEARDGRHREELDMMDRNFNDTVDSYMQEIQDLKNLVEKKEADILALKKEYLNQAQQNETLMRREQGIIDDINQFKIRV